MKNLKNFAFGLLVAVLAVGFSAFTNAKTSGKVDTYLVQTSLGTWEERTVEPDGFQCDPQEAKQCYYKVNDDSILHSGSYTEMEIDNYLQASPAQIQNGQNSQPGLFDE